MSEEAHGEVDRPATRQRKPQSQSLATGIVEIQVPPRYVEPASQRLHLYGEQSERIHLLIEALAQGQAEVELARRTHTSEYGLFASLEDVWRVYQKAFPKHGLAVTQVTHVIDGNPSKRCLVTQLSHVSGQWMRSIEPLMCSDPDAQQRKSELTLVRRMALCALLGIVDGDDDGDIQHQAESARKSMALPGGPQSRMEELAQQSFDSAVTAEAREACIEKCRQHAAQGRIRQEFVARLAMEAGRLNAMEESGAKST